MTGYSREESGKVSHETPIEKPCSLDSSNAEEFIKLSNEKFSHPAPDPYLPEYLEKLKKRLIREENFKGWVLHYK